MPGRGRVVRRSSHRAASYRPISAKAAVRLGTNLGKVAKRAYNAWKSKPSAAKKSYAKKQKSTGGPSSWPADDIHSAKARSGHVIVLRKHKGKVSGTGEFNYEQQNAQSVSCATGTQTTFAISQDLTATQILIESGVRTDPGPHEYHLGLMQYNPWLRASGDTAGILNAGAAATNSKLFVKSIFYEIQFSNASNTPLDFLFYAVTPKKGPFRGWQTSVSFNQLTTGSLTDMQTEINNLPGPPSVQATDITSAQNPATFGKPGLTTYGFNPWQMAGYRKLYHCKMKREFNLAAGAYHKMTIRVDVNQYFSGQMLAPLIANGGDGIPGASIQFFGILRGSPVIVKDAAGVPYVTNEAASTSAVQLAMTYTRKIKGTFVRGGNAMVDYVVPTFRSVGGTTTTQIMDMEDTQIAGDIVK